FGRRPRDAGDRLLQAAGLARPGGRHPRSERRQRHAHPAAARLHRAGGPRSRSRSGDPVRDQPAVPREARHRLARAAPARGRLRPRPRRGRGARARVATARRVTDAPAPGERLQKVLARAGVASRRASEELIEAGRVRVNGRTAELGMRVDAAADVVEVDGTRLSLAPGLVYYLLNKPAGVVSTASDPQGRPTVV